MTGERTATAAPVLFGAPVTVTEHADGLPHVRATVAKMAELATAASHSYEIRNLATRITHGVPSKDVRGELAAIYRWVRDNIRYRFDPLGLEWVQAPARTVIEQAGDCDDMATLIAALVGALGHRWQYRTVGPSRNVQKHIAAEAFDGTQWVTLDPVLEPMQPSTSPRADLGRFGAYANGGATLFWNDGGQMLRGIPTATGVKLWRGDIAGLGAAKRGRARARRVVHVRGYNVPAHSRAWPSSQLSLLGGIPTPAQCELWSFTPYQHSMLATPIPSPAYRSPGAPGFDAEGRSLLALAPGEVNEGAQLDGLGGYSAELGSIWGSIKKVGRVVGKVVKGGAKLVKKVGSSTAGKIALPVLALNVDPKLKAVRDVVAKKIPGAQQLVDAQRIAEQAGGAFVKATTKGGKLKLPKLPAGVKLPAGLKLPGSAAAIVKAAKGAKKKAAAKLTPEQQAAKLAKAFGGKPFKLALRSGDWKKPHPKIAKKYPKGARQTFDQKAGVFRVYMPKAKAKGTKKKRAVAGVAGLGLKPTFTISLGAVEMTAADYKRNGAALANAAANAVATFIRSRADHRPPGKSVPAVLEFQRYDSLRDRASFQGRALEPDGEWGPNTRTAAAWYMDVTASSLPPYLPAMENPVTWQPPVATVRAAPTPAPAPRPAATPRPVITVDDPRIVPAKPKPAAAPTTPAPAGYVEIGTERDNPGLTPVGAPTVITPASSAPSSSSSAKKAKPKAKAKAKPATVTPITAARSSSVEPAPAYNVVTDPVTGAQTLEPRPSITVDDPIIVDVTGPAAPVLQPLPPPPPMYPPPPLPGDPSSRQVFTQADADADVTTGPRVWPWLVLWYLLERSRKRAA